MIRTTNTNSNNNINSTNSSNENNIQLDIGEPNAKNNLANIIPGQNLYSRELIQLNSFDENMPKDLIYEDKVLKYMREGILCFIKHTIEFIQNKIDKNFTLEYNENDLEELTFKLSQLFIKIYPKYESEYIPYSESFIIKKMDEIYDAQKNEIGEDAINNGGICLKVILSLKYWTCSLDRSLVNEFDFIQKSTESQIKDIDSTIDAAITTLEKIKEEKYFTIFRLLIDIQLTVKEKYIKIQNYFYLPPIQGNESVESLTSKFKSYVFEISQNMALHLTQLQILLEALIQLKKAPKTIENIKKLSQISNNCLNCYEEDNIDYTFLKKSREYRQFSYIKDYFFAKSHLTRINQEFIKIIEKASPKSVNNDWTSHAFLSKKNKKCQQSQKKSNTKATRSPLPSKSETPEMNSPKISEIKKTESINESNPIQNEVQLTSSQKFEEKENTIDTIISDINSEDNFEAILQETNICMEIFRQTLEKDRAKKLQLKIEREKQKKASHKLNPEIINTTNNSPKLEIIKFSNAHQDTLFELFREKPRDFVLHNDSIHSLIIKLNGKTEGEGNGSRFKIFWTNSNNHQYAKTYEFRHDKDPKGYLSSKNASKVATAIKLGIQWGYIPKETFDAINLEIMPIDNQ